MPSPHDIRPSGYTTARREAAESERRHEDLHRVASRMRSREGARCRVDDPAAEERPSCVRVDLSPAQMRRLEAAGWEPGSMNLGEWLTLRAEVAAPGGEAASIYKLRADLETERMRLAACGAVALGYHRQGDDIHPDYRSGSLDNVLALRAERDRLKDWLTVGGTWYLVTPERMAELQDVEAERDRLRDKFARVRRDVTAMRNQREADALANENADTYGVAVGLRRAVAAYDAVLALLPADAALEANDE